MEGSEPESLPQVDDASVAVSYIADYADILADAR